MILGMLAQLSMAKKQKKMAAAINPVNPEYKESQYAKDSLGLMQQLYGGRMAGASAATDNIFQSQANAANTFEKNSTDTSQILAGAGGVQGQTNAALVDLATKEAQDKMMKAQMVENANQVMTAEGDKVFADKMRNFDRDYNTKQSLIGASLQNKFGAIKGFEDNLMKVASMFVNPIGGGMGMMGGGGSTGGGMSMPTPYLDPNKLRANLQTRVG
jgi:hypothetical protein